VKVLRNASASRTTLASLGALYLLVVTLTVILINRILAAPIDTAEGIGWVLAGFGVLFALGLLVALGVSVLRLLRDRGRGRPGSGFKARLTGFFSLVVLLAAVPQGIVSVSFLEAGIDMIFRSGTADAVRGGLDLALDYYERHVYDVRQVAIDGTLQRLIDERAEILVASDVPAPAGLMQPEMEPPVEVPAVAALWPELARRLPRTATVQLFDLQGRSVHAAGEELFVRTAAGPAGVVDGTPRIGRATIAGEAVLQMVAAVVIGPERVPGAAILTVRFPENLERTARLLTDSQSLFTRFESVRPTVLLLLAITYGIFAAPILLLAVMAGFFLSDRIMRPIEALEEATRRVSDGDYTVRILARPGEDLGVLVVSFNRMVTELDRARRRMAQAEKVQAWQEIAQRLAHEVKNPLTPIRLAAERLERRYQADAPDFGEVLTRTVRTIMREVDALTGLLDEFRSFSRMPEPQFAPVAILPLLREVAAVYRDNPEVAIVLEGVDPDASVAGDRGQLRQVIVNLLTNSIEAAGTVRVVVSSHRIERGNRAILRLRVEDDGPGIPEEIRDTIFDPYVTSKNRGTGLGLAIVERIVFDHDGRISCESAPGSGATFVIDLPVEHEQ
jgi:two-component system, NtrC family, nitrogen regulation sensor histidine kinase NtrY